MLLQTLYWSFHVLPCPSLSIRMSTNSKSPIVSKNLTPMAECPKYVVSSNFCKYHVDHSMSFVLSGRTWSYYIASASCVDSLHMKTKPRRLLKWGILSHAHALPFLHNQILIFSQYNFPIYCSQLYATIWIYQHDIYAIPFCEFYLTKCARPSFANHYCFHYIIPSTFNLLPPSRLHLGDTVIIEPLCSFIDTLFSKPQTTALMHLIYPTKESLNIMTTQ